MTAGFATVTEEAGVSITSADVNGFVLAELRFPPTFVQGPFEPELPYLAVVLDGTLEKSFPLRTMGLGRADAIAMPAGARHGARFGAVGATIVIVKLREARDGASGCFRRPAGLREPCLGWLGWRLAGELRASDAVAPIAAEGLALELLAAAGREACTEPPLRRPPAWLAAVEARLREATGDHVGLGELADAAGVHPAHVARVFRARHGVSVGEYARRVRVAWAAGELARTETPLSAIARQAGFADQSHLTRLFRRHLGVTPARYRAEARRGERTSPSPSQEGSR